jgi:hypothetical protein
MKMHLTCQSFHRMQRNTLKGFADITVGEMQLTIKDVAIHEKNNSRWAALPSKPMLKDGAALKDDTGKIKYSPILQFGGRDVADAFSAAAIRAVLDHSPDAFDAAAAAAKPKAGSVNELDDAIPF